MSESKAFADVQLRKLAERFDFTPDDLAANREGRLSDRQRESYRRRGHRVPYISAAVGAVIGGLFGWSAATHSAPPLDLVSGFGLLIGGLLFCWIPAMFLKWWILRRPLKHGTVKTISGPVTMVTARYYQRMVLIGLPSAGRTWHRHKDDQELFSEIPFARLYYLQGWGTTEIHSIEPIGLAEYQADLLEANGT